MSSVTAQEKSMVTEIYRKTIGGVTGFTSVTMLRRIEERREGIE